MKICILGSGILGVTSAYYLAKAGHDVTVIDRQSEPARECSFANGGQLSYSHAEPWANPGVFPKLWKWMFQDDAPLVLRPRADIRMLSWGAMFLLNCLPARAQRHSEALLRIGLYSKAQMQLLMQETAIDFHHIGKGILHVFSDQKGFDHARKQAEFQGKHGCPETVLSMDEAIALEPSIAHSQKKLYGAIHSPIDESGDIHVFTKNLAALCREKFGVKFLFAQSITRVHAAGKRITHIETDQGYLQDFDTYVMCMGAHSPIFLRQVGIRVPIYPMKGYSLTLQANEFTPTLSVTDDALKIVYSRLGDRIRVAGTAEFAGYNDSIRKVRTDAIRRGIEKLFPKAEMSNISEWACLRPSTPDGPPIIGASPLQNLYLNTGHGTLGWTQAAGSARLLADIIGNIPTEIPLTGLELSRYRLVL